MAGWAVVVDGTEYSLSDGALCRVHDVDGIGVAPSVRLREQGPMQHGQTDRGMRLGPRLVRLALDVVATTRADLETRLQTLETLFAPHDTPLLLRRYRHDAAVRQLDCYFAGSFTLPASARLGPCGQRVAVDLDAADPAWYDPTQAATSLTLLGSGLAVPMSVPFSVAPSVISSVRTVSYPGTWRDFPTVKITGPITDPVVKNLTTDEQLNLTGATIAGGQWVEIDTRWGRKTVVDQDGDNQIALLTADSDLATFHLASTRESGETYNELEISGSGANSLTSIVLRYYLRYIGV